MPPPGSEGSALGIEAKYKDLDQWFSSISSAVSLSGQYIQATLKTQNPEVWNISFWFAIVMGHVVARWKNGVQWFYCYDGKFIHRILLETLILLILRNTQLAFESYLKLGLLLSIYITSHPGPGAAHKKINAFFVKLFRFWSLGYPGFRESSWQG